MRERRRAEGEGPEGKARREGSPRLGTWHTCEVSEPGSTRLQAEPRGREAGVCVSSGHHVRLHCHQGPCLFHVCLTLEVSVSFTFRQPDGYKHCRCRNVCVPEFE